MRLNTAEFIVIYIHTYIYIYIIYKKSVPIVYFIIVSIIIMIISSILLLIITYLTKLLSRFDLPDLPKDSMLRLSPIKTKTKKRRSEQKSQKNKIKKADLPKKFEFLFSYLYSLCVDLILVYLMNPSKWSLKFLACHIGWFFRYLGTNSR